MKLLRWTLIALVVCAALLAVACGSEEAAEIEPAPEPTAAPTSTPEPTATPTPEPPPAPEAPTPPVAPEAPVMTFDVPDLPPDATGQDIVDNLLTEEEATCVRDTIGDAAYAGMLQANVLDPNSEVTGGQVLGPCLSKESAILFFLAGMSGLTGGAISDESLNCIGNALWPLEVNLFAAEPDPSLAFAFLPCVTPEELVALTSLAPAPQ